MVDKNSVELSAVNVEQLAKDIVKIERHCFYGDEPERDRLKKIRETLIREIQKDREHR